jgi:hypothetical protein
MKKLFIYFFFIVSSSYSQTSDALKLCVAIQNKFTSNYEANNAVDKILSVIGTSQKPILQPCSNINNAVAASYKGQRYILYDKDFMESLTVGRNKYWSNMFILAHEVGHHINGHSLDIILYQNDVINPKSLSTRRSQELEADEFAGFVLAKLGATFNQTSKVLLNIPKISNDYDSTHPSTDKRIRAVKNGWERGYVKKETKTVYVSDAIGEYERSDSYMRYGKWYREQNDDVFEGRSWTAVTSGVLKGGNDYFNKAPIIKIIKNKKSEKPMFFIEKEPFNSLPIPKESNKGDLIVLDSNGKIISKTKINVYPRNDSGFLYVKFGTKFSFYEEDGPYGGFGSLSSKLLKDFKNGSKLLIRFDDYIKYSNKKLKEYVKSNSLFKINNWGRGQTGKGEGGYTKLYDKLKNKGVYIESYQRNQGSDFVPENNYRNRLFTSYELLEEIKKLKEISRRCGYSDGQSFVYPKYFEENLSYTSPTSDREEVFVIPRGGNCNMSRIEYDLKIDNLIQKLLDLNSEIFALKNQLIEVEGAYFEYSLSGSSKALAE